MTDEELLRRTLKKTKAEGVGLRVDYRNRAQAERLERAGLAVVLDVKCGDGHRDRIFVTRRGLESIGEPCPPSS